MWIKFRNLVSRFVQNSSFSQNWIQRTPKSVTCGFNMACCLAWKPISTFARKLQNREFAKITCHMATYGHYNLSEAKKRQEHEIDKCSTKQKLDEKNTSTYKQFSLNTGGQPSCLGMYLFINPAVFLILFKRGGGGVKPMLRKYRFRKGILT